MKLTKTGFPLAFLGMAAVVGIVLVTAFNHMTTTSPELARRVNGRVPVETQTLDRVDFREIVGAAGILEASSKVNYIAPFLGRVTRVPVDLGTVVRRGDLLVQFDDREFQAALAGALERVEAAGMILEVSRLQAERLRQLHEDGLAAERDVQAAVEDVAEAKLRLAHAREELVQARVTLERTRITAPMNGIVLERHVNPDEITQHHQKLLTIGSLDSVTLVAQVSEDKIGSLLPGQEARVTCDAMPGEVFSGQVVKIDPSTDPQSRVFSAYVKIANEDLRLRPGLTGFARFERNRELLAVPSMALIDPLGDRATAFVVDDDQVARLREVKVGAVGERLREVLAGLSEGETVVTAGHHRLREGDPVTTSEAPAAVRP